MVREDKRTRGSNPRSTIFKMSAELRWPKCECASARVQVVTESPLSFRARKNSLTASDEKGGGVMPAHAVTDEIFTSIGGDKPGQVSVSAPPTS